MSQALEQCPFCNTSITLHWPRTGFSKCSSCDLLVRNPFPSDNELTELYLKSWQNPRQNRRETGGTDINLARIYGLLLAKSLSLNDFSGLKILDFGAGRGAMLAALAELGADVCGVEPFGWEFLETAGFPTYRTLFDLPQGSRLDGIVAIDVIEHLSAPWLLLRQLGELLKENGWIFIATANAAGMGARVFGPRYREAQKPGHLMLFTPATLERILARCGLARYRRLKWFVQYSQNPLIKLLHYGLQLTRLDGELRYIAWK